MTIESISNKPSGTPTIRSSAEEKLGLRSLARSADPAKKSNISSFKGDLDKIPSFGKNEMNTINDILKNPKLKDAVDVFTDEKKLASFNKQFDGVKKTINNPLLRYFSGGNSSGNTTDKINRFATTYTTRGKNGKMKMEKMGVVMKKAFQSGNGFFSGMFRSIKAVFGYGLASKYKKELFLWTPAQELASKVKKHTANAAEKAGKVAKVGGAALSEVKEHKSDKLALEAMKRKQKNELNTLFKKGSKIKTGDLVSKTQNIYKKSFNAGMKADPEGFKKQLRKKGGVGGMKLTRGLGGLMVAQIGVNAIMTGLNTGDFGDFKEEFFTFDNIISFIPGIDLWQAGNDIAKILKSGEPATTEELVDIIINAGFGIMDVAFIISTMGGGLILKGGSKVVKSELREQFMKKGAKKGLKGGTEKLTKEGLQKAEKEATEKLAKGGFKNATKTATKAGRGQLITMSMPSIKSAFLKFTPSGRIFSRLFLNKEQKRFMRIAKK